MPLQRILILTERAPPSDAAPAVGLSVRHARIAAQWAGRGVDVVYAWPAEGGAATPSTGSWRQRPLEDRAALESLIDRWRPQAVVLGYWQLADWLPRDLGCALILDHVAPRLLESQFEEPNRLGDAARALLAVLARCDEVWVGNKPQQDLMTGLLLLAGHDCRFGRAARVVPIAGRPREHRSAPGRADAAIRLYHGGRDWPWRDSEAWLRAIGNGDGDGHGRWRLVDGSEAAGLSGYGDYIEQLRSADVALELSDDNVERRFSQSFRMTDALLNGVPVICNRFLPLARAIVDYRAGWVVDDPAELPALLESIDRDRDELLRRSRNALELARDRLDADAIYGGLVAALGERIDQPRAAARPLLGDPPAAGRAPGLLQTTRTHARRGLGRLVRWPMHAWLRRRAALRPVPSERGGRCWIVVSRSDLFPTNHGAAVKIERTAWGLSFHVDEVLLLTDRRGGYWRYVRGEREYRAFPLWPRIAGWPRAVNRIRLEARGIPESNVNLYLPLVDRGINLRLFWLLRRYPVEVVQGEFPAYARPAIWAARLFGVASVLVEHNVEFERIAEQVPDLSADAAARLKALEIGVANSCDHVVAVSDRDRHRLVEHGVEEQRIRTVPHGVDLERFDAASAIDLRAAYDLPRDCAVLVYHGIYSYPPNLDAVRELSARLLPALADRGIDARVVAIGPEPPASRFGGVVFTGAVDDLAAHLKGGDLAVIPLRAGGGTRMKILDDFAAGVPVVSTAKGMEGIPVTDGVHLVVAEDSECIAAAVAALLGDEQRRSALASQARAWVQDLDWRAIAGRYVDLVRADT